MMATQDENSYYLNEYQHRQEELEQKWIYSLGNKVEDFIEYAVQVLEGDCFSEEFSWCFASMLNDDASAEKLYQVIDDWSIGDLQEDDEQIMRDIALLALEGAAEILEDEDIHEVAAVAGKSIKHMVEEVVG